MKTKSSALSPLLIVQDAAMRKDSPLSPAQRFVACAIGKMLNRDNEGHYSAHATHRYLAGLTGYSVRTVSAAVARLCDGPDALFERKRGGRYARGVEKFGSMRVYRYRLKGARCEPTANTDLRSERGPDCVTDEDMDHATFNADERAWLTLTHIENCADCDGRYRARERARYTRKRDAA